LRGSDVTLAQARNLAERWRAVAAAGRDPVKERAAEERAARREDISLANLTHYTFESRKSTLKADGAAGRWLSPLEAHVLPKLGKVPVTDIDQRDIRDALAPVTRGPVLYRAGPALRPVLFVLFRPNPRVTAPGWAPARVAATAPAHIKIS
jgi:hypothetical protein